MIKNFALRIVFIYIIFAGLYIIVSDRILLSFFTDQVTLSWAQTYKGWVYVIVTGLLLYFLINSQLRKIKDIDTLLKRSNEINKQLKKINEELREVNKKRDIFITSMGHELRHPLNSILGFTDVLLKEYSGKINEEQKRQLEIIKESSKDLLSLINEVIDIFRIELTKNELVFKPFDIERLIFETVNSFRAIGEQKGLKIEVVSPGRVEIVSDENRLKQVLKNLISNSIKFTDAGGIKIELVDGEDFVNLAIQDSGIGMSNGDMKYLFEPFSIIHFKNRPDVEGVGLGLYICKRIINLLNGEIFIESKLKKGTKVTVKLPKGSEVK